MKTVIVNHHIKLVHDYDLEKTDTGFKLIKSDNGEWSNPGEVAATLKDNGECIKINIGGKKIKLDYSEIQELHILLQASEFPSFKIK